MRVKRHEEAWRVCSEVGGYDNEESICMYMRPFIGPYNSRYFPSASRYILSVGYFSFVVRTVETCQVIANLVIMNLL